MRTLASNSDRHFNLLVHKFDQPHNHSSNQPTRISSIEGFLAAISETDPIDITKSYSFSLYKHQLKSNDPANIDGGKFVIYFRTNVAAFRTFCLFSINWIKNMLQFGNNLVGGQVILSEPSYSIELWFDKYAKPNTISGIYQNLNDFIKQYTNIQCTDYCIEFRVHPSSQPVIETTGMKSKSNHIPTFQSLINQLLCENPPEKLPLFNYDIAIYHKRSREERRQKKSTLDQL